MKEIQLTQGKVALVDDEDFERLNQFHWLAVKHGHNLWYAMRHGKKVNGRQPSFYLHRDILNAPKGIKCDHKDCDGLNNQRANLRLCTDLENARNIRPQTRKLTSVFKGVHFRKDRGKWRVLIRYNGKQKYVGSFHTENEAAEAYNQKALENFGQFARLNVLPKELARCLNS